MATQNRIQTVLEKIRSQKPLDADELTELQTKLDELEDLRSSSSHHETTSHHHTSAVALGGVLEQIAKTGKT